jgi:hypothetical protein
VHLQYGRKCEGDRGGFHITVAFFADDEIACQQYDAEVCGNWFRAYSSTTEVLNEASAIRGDFAIFVKARTDWSQDAIGTTSWPGSEAR